MKNYVVCYRPAACVEQTRELNVAAPSIEQAIEKARRLLSLRYPNYRLTGAWPGLDFDSDSDELYSLVERLRAER